MNILVVQINHVTMRLSRHQSHDVQIYIRASIQTCHNSNFWCSLVLVKTLCYNFIGVYIRAVTIPRVLDFKKNL